MLRGLYTAYTGMEAQQQKMDIISNNLANASTAGFKQDNVVFKSFSEVLATKINDPTKKTNENIGKMSLGVQIDNIYTNFEQGGLNLTEDMFSTALEGDGMITVGMLNQDGSYSERFTRDGSLTIKSDGMLVTTSGYPIMGENGPIYLSDSKFSITQKGDVYIEGEWVDKIKITSFVNNNTLKKMGDSLYAMTDLSEKTEFKGAIRQGYSEASNVNAVKEMIEMISMMRAYEANQKVLTTYDGTLENVVNNVGRI